MDKLLFLFELSIKELKKNKKINIVVMLSLALGILMPLMALANINVYWVNIKNLYPQIDQNTYYCNLNTGHLTGETYLDIKELLDAVKVGGCEKKSSNIIINDTSVSEGVCAISEEFLDFVKYDLMSGRRIEEEEITTAKRVCMVEESLLSKYNLAVEIGDYIEIGGEAFQVVGIIRTMELINQVLVPAGIFDGRYDIENNSYTMFVQMKTLMDEKVIQESLQEKVENIYSIQKVNDYFKAKRSECSVIALGIFSITIPLMIFSIVNCILVLYGKIVKMKYEIGIKMALGAEKKEIFFSCFFENGLLALGAYFIDILILPLIIKTVPVGFLLLFDFKVYLSCFLLMVLLCFLMSLRLTRKIMKFDIASVLKGE